jgi:hypothetical protein
MSLSTMGYLSLYGPSPRGLVLGQLTAGYFEGRSEFPRSRVIDAPRVVSDFTSACCTSRLARGNAQQRTHSETSSNYL